MGCCIVLGIQTCRPKTPVGQEAYYHREAWRSAGNWGFNQETPVQPSTMVASTPHHDWEAIATGRGLDGRIYQSPPVAHTSTTITVKQQKRDLMPPVPEVPPSVRSPSRRRRLLSKANLGPGGTPGPKASNQKPVYNALNWQPPPKLVISMHKRGAEMKRSSLNIRSTVNLFGLWTDSSDLHTFEM